MLWVGQLLEYVFSWGYSPKLVPQQPESYSKGGVFPGVGDSFV
jgi:hypothetical protein